MAGKYGVLGPDGYIEISEELLDQLGASPGWRYSQQIVKRRLEICFFPPKHNKSPAGVLKEYIDPAAAAELDGLLLGGGKGASDDCNDRGTGHPVG